MAHLSLALLLLTGAGLLIKTVVRSVRFDPGFDTSRVLQGHIWLAALRSTPPASIDVFARGVLEQLSRIPGTRAGVQSFVFFGGFGARSRKWTLEGIPSVPDGASPRFYFAVSPGYFRMLGATLKQGREFSPADGSDVVIVHHATAQDLRR